MRHINFLIALALLAAPAASQQALNEQFQFSLTGMFPPAGWVEINVNTGRTWAGRIPRCSRYR